MELSARTKKLIRVVCVVCVAVIVLGLVFSGYVIEKHNQDAETGTETSTASASKSKKALELKLAASIIFGLMLIYASCTFYKSNKSKYPKSKSIIIIPIICVLCVAFVIYHFSAEIHHHSQQDKNDKNEAMRKVGIYCMYIALTIVIMIALCIIGKLGYEKIKKLKNRGKVNPVSENKHSNETGSDVEAVGDDGEGFDIHLTQEDADELYNAATTGRREGGGDGEQ